MTTIRRDPKNGMMWSPGWESKATAYASEMADCRQQRQQKMLISQLVNPSAIFTTDSPFGIERQHSRIRINVRTIDSKAAPERQAVMQMNQRRTGLRRPQPRPIPAVAQPLVQVDQCHQGWHPGRSFGYAGRSMSRTAFRV